MKRISTGLWLAVALIVACHFGANWVRAGYGGKVLPPEKKAASLPSQLAGWHAVEDIPLDEKTANVMGAGDFVSRVYRNAVGQSVSIHVAFWTDFRDGPTGLHYPEVCYPNAGWQILGTEDVRPSESAGVQPMRLMLMEQAGSRIVTAHWYEMGEADFFSRSEAREIQRRFWGERELPFVAKVLIQYAAPDVETAKPQLEKIAADLSAWTKQLR
ncbi:MAG: exosortase C-terminal domain/associated protein EpsI [Planctomycetaceae bacterium]